MLDYVKLYFLEHKLKRLCAHVERVSKNIHTLPLGDDRILSYGLREAYVYLGKQTLKDFGEVIVRISRKNNRFAQKVASRAKTVYGWASFMLSENTVMRQTRKER